MKRPDKLTIQNLKAFEASADTAKLRADLLAATLRAAAVRCLVDSYSAPILARYDFRRTAFDGDGSPITKVSDLYLFDDSSPEDAAKLAAFYAELDREAAAHGFDVPAGYCPALVAEDDQRRAERALLRHAAGWFGMDGLADSYGEIRAAALRLFANGPTRNAA